MQKIELLAPAGSPEALRTAVLYGADAVYLGGERFGLREKARNFTREQMQESIAFAHAHGVKVHTTVNIIAHNHHFDGLEEYLLNLKEDGVDAIIAADTGIIETARQVIPEVPVHLSTQASATNYRTMNFWYRNGVSRVVAARELSIRELEECVAKAEGNLEIECFVHGAMCISISGRCLLSNYMARKDANLGACVHPCRWKYRLVEETRPDEYYPVAEGEEGTYIFNSKDLCMIEHIPDLVRIGIRSLKIEGRMKTPLYVAMVTKAYREAIDDYYTDPALYESRKGYYLSLLSQVSHRGYNTGFFYGHPDYNSQVYESSEYIKKLNFVAKVLEADHPNKLLKVEQRNKFSIGDEVLYLLPHGGLQSVRISRILNESGELQQDANHAQQTLYLDMPDFEVPVGTIITRRIEAGE